MPTPGYVFRDSGITPPAEEESENQKRQLSLDNSQSSKTTTQPSSHTSRSSQSSRQTQSFLSPLQEKSSDSHALAAADHDVKGAAQLAGQTSDLSDLGWRSHPKDLGTLVGGLSNEQLWILIRRFNKVREAES